jgi:hypothetical protein
MMNPAWSYALTFVGLVGQLLAGRKKTLGWAIGFSAQGLWAAYAVTTGQYGFLIGSLAYGYVYALNWFTWRREQAEKAKGQTPDQRLQELAYEMLSTASPDGSLADRVRHAEVLIRFSKTAAAWEKENGTPERKRRMPRASDYR